MLPRVLAVLPAAAAAVLLTANPRAQAPVATLIRNASLVDGTGAPPRRADVRIAGDRIAAVGELTATADDRTVDAAGLVLAPGFIDTHSHHDRGLPSARDALAAVSQGITTIVVGQDGGSAFPIASFLADLDAQPAAVNVASYVGHGTLRRQAMAADFKRKATDDEVRRMEELLRGEMAAGALGLSTGLEYDPGIYSDPVEVIRLAKVAASRGGRYISHLRSEDRTLWAAVEEAIAIGREAKLPVQISHLKLAMRSLWGQTGRLVGMLDRARAGGVQVTADVYPYTYWQSTATVLFPARNFNDRAEAEFVLKELVAPEGLLFGSFPPHPAYAGKTLAEIAGIRKTAPAETLLHLIGEAESAGTSAGIVATSMDEADVAGIMRWPHANICSDGMLGGAHPRGYGSFTRVLGRYVRERGILRLPEAIRKMTSLSAANVGIQQRGLIAPGRYADLVLFNPETVIDRASTGEPHAVSGGIAMVWVNGEVVFRDGATTRRYPGRVLRRP
jgi:N-acyl-D-amino-acid deacylase